MAFTLPRSICQSIFRNRLCNWHFRNYSSDSGKTQSIPLQLIFKYFKYMLKVLLKLWTCPSSFLKQKMLTWVKLIWTHLFLWINVLPHLKTRPWRTHKTKDQWWQYSKCQRKSERFILMICRKTCITLTSAKSDRCRTLHKCNRN